MSKAKRSTIEVQGTSIGILAQPGGNLILTPTAWLQAAAKPAIQ